MLHNLGFTMVYHRLSSIDIPGLRWCASCHTCHPFRGAAHRCDFGAFLSFFCFAVVSIMTVVESAIPGTSMLKGEPIELAVPWVTLSVSLNIIVTSMICFRLLRMRARIRQVLSPEMSSAYTSIATMLIESAAPFSVVGIGLVVTAAQQGPLVFAFGYVWSIFCVKSKPSLPCSRFASTPKTTLTELYPPFLLVFLPANDHPPGCHGPWMAQGDYKRAQHCSRIREFSPGQRAKSGSAHGDPHHR
jgi:hypothetical protein